MPSERVQRQIDRLLDEAAAAVARFEWADARQNALAALAFDADNADAQAYLAAAEHRLGEDATPPAGPASGQTSVAPAGDATPPAAAPLPAAFANGRYQVQKLLGEGGKKRVYQAHDTLLDRDVAFALIKTEGLDAGGRERITREAQAMGRLGAHPHIVSVFDLGEHEGQPYLVTELMGGGDIEGLIASAGGHKLPLADALRIANQTAAGLAFAHSKGIVHRDLKPGNIWLTADGTAKIGDFGLAVAIDRSRLTQAGMMVGTVSYMPPEQATGGEVTARSDLYSLGCMLYELVTGRPPFIGDESVAIIGQHLNTPPVAPTWHRPDCPPGLEALILRLLEKDASKRPASAGEVGGALEALVRGGVGAAPRGRPGEVGGADRGTQAGDPSDAAGRPHGAAPTGNTADPLYRRAFVGREAELKQLHAAFDAALSGRGGLVMVVGEPGIGKTSVIEQLSTYAALRGGKALIGHCYEEGSLSLPYLPFVEAMRSYVLAREPDGLKSDVGTGAGDIARIVSEVRDRVGAQFIAPSETGDPEEQRWRLLQAVTGFLRSASQVTPLLLVLEDLHDADRGTLDLLVHLSRNLEGARLLIAGTYRDVEVDRQHPLSNTLADLRRVNTFLRVPLRGMTADEVQRMMAAVAQRDIPWAFAELIHRQTEGNPLFVQEMLRYLVEEGLVHQQDGSLRRVGDESLVGRIPEGLRDVIGKRLSRLSDKTNHVLSIAAVVGRDFRLDVLERVSGLPEDEVEAALEAATAIAVVEQRQAVGSLAFRFTHAFFRQTLYEEIFAARRLRLHQQVARALEAVYGRRVEEHAAELAEHFAQSTDAADLAKALEYSELAAQRAMGVYAYGEAVKHLEQALKVQEVLAPDDKAKRCDLLLALGEALMSAGEPLRTAEHVAEEAFLLAQGSADADRTSAACSLGLDALFRYGGTSAAPTPLWGTWAGRADRSAQDNTLGRVHADLALGIGRMMEQSELDRERYQLRALELARRLGDQKAIFDCGARLLLGTGSSLDAWEQGRNLAEELVHTQREGVRTITLAQVLSGSGSHFLAWGDRDRLEELWREVDDLAQRTRDPYVLLRPMIHGLVLHTLNGNLENAVETAERLMTTSEEMGSALYGSQGAVYLGMRARLYLGRAGDVLDGLHMRLQRFGVDTPSRRLLPLAHLGRRQEVEELLSKGVMHDNSAAAVVQALEAATLIENREAAALLMERLTPLRGLVSSRSQDTTVFARHLGAAAALLGEPDQARAYYQQAIDVCTRVRFRPELALTRLQLAELLLDHYPDERSAAIEHLDFAIRECGDMKMQPSLERALRRRELLGA